MRRYLSERSPEELPQKQYDVVIAGGGLAGLYLALQLDRRLKVCLLVKNSIGKCNSALAQGGIAAVVDKDDDFNIHVEDTIKASAGVANAKLVEFMVHKGPEEIMHLASLGVDFDTAPDGRWLTTREGGHTRNRILHCGGDATGKVLIENLSLRVSERENIDVLENHFLVDVLTSENDRVCGVIALAESDVFIKAPVVAICTGGIGALYQYSTNRSQSTGDGIAAAIRAGVETTNMEYVQFHPTAFRCPDTEKSFFLISEAVRGEGGILRNVNGEAFMEGRHPLKDLAPRDLVARQIFLEMKNTRSHHVFLDTTSLTAEFLSNRFPTIYRKLKEYGYQMERDLIPVMPVQHYFMGGIKTDLSGASSIKGLFASGEAACTGVHGANRLASNSLLECLVFGSQCAIDINSFRFHEFKYTATKIEPKKDNSHNYIKLKEEIGELMQLHGGIIRNEEGLSVAISRIEEILQMLDNNNLNSVPLAEVYNMALVAKQILLAALENKNNIGSHYRDDV